jgi:hypothetical protein
MLYRKNNIVGVRLVGARFIEPSRRMRSQSGSIMPFIAVSVILFLGTVGVASELTRIFEAVNELKFAAQAAALYGCSLSVVGNNNYSTAIAQSNIQNGVTTASTAGWNTAECGPTGNVFVSGTVSRGNLTWNDAVTFAPSDIQFVNNPVDTTEFFTQVTARRQGSDVLQQFFLPLLWLYTNSIGTKLSATQFNANPYQTVEVLGQPASRIGPGAPLGSTAGSTASNYIGWAVLPIAISNQEFATIANPNQTTTTYTIDLVSPNTPVQSGHIAGCLVNLAATSGSGSSYYGAGTGSTAVSQLISLLYYFSGNTQQSLAPALVEQGSQLNAFNPTDPTFVSQQSQINKVLSALPNQFYILPVLANDPSFSSSNQVVGFAWFQLNPSGVNITNGVVTSFSMNIGPGAPVYNAISTGGYSAIPGNTSNLLPSPVAPFLPRQYDSSSGGVSVRQRGVVLAPAISPRLNLS